MRASRAAALWSRGETSLASSLTPGAGPSSASGGGGGGGGSTAAGGGSGGAAAGAGAAAAAARRGGLAEALLALFEGKPVMESPLLRLANNCWAGSNEDPSPWELRAASALAVAIWARSPAMATTEHTSLSPTEHTTLLCGDF